MLITGKGVTTYLAIRIKILNKKQKSGFFINAITNQYLRDFLRRSNNSPYLGYKKKEVDNEPTEACFFQIRQFSKIIKNNRRVWLRTKGVKFDIDKKSRQQNNWTSKQKNNL